MILEVDCFIHTSTAVWRIPFIQASPSLEVRSIPGVRVVQPFRREILDYLDLSRILSDGAECDASDSVVKVAVFDVYVGRVLLQSNAIIAVVYSPALKGDVVGVDLNCTCGQQCLMYAVLLGLTVSQPSVFTLQASKVPMPGSQLLLT